MIIKYGFGGRMRPVFERWAKSVRQYDLGDIGKPRRFIMDAQIGPMNFRDKGGPWRAIDESFVESDGETFSARFSKLPYIFRMGEDSHRRFYPDRDNDQIWIEFEKPFANMGKPTKIGNIWTWDFPHAAMSITVGAIGIKMTFILKDSQAPSDLIIPFTIRGLTREGLFLLASGVPVARLRRFFAIDAVNVERELDVSFMAGAVRLQLDTTELIYPITVDPTIDKDVAVSADDGYWRNSPVVFDNTNTRMFFGFATDYYNSWARFTDISGLSGATIDVSNIQVYGFSTAGTPLAYVDADDSATPAAPTSEIDAAGKTHTTSNVAWNGTLFMDAWNTSPSLNVIFQELADSYDPSAIQVFIMGQGSILNYNGVRTIDYGSLAPKLHIEYTAGITIGEMMTSRHIGQIDPIQFLILPRPAWFKPFHLDPVIFGVSDGFKALVEFDSYIDQERSWTTER